MSRFNVVVIGGGPAGISAAIAASFDGASVLLVERDARLGGVLHQCIHDAFGFIRHGEWLTGPEYAFDDISILEQTNAHFLLQTTVTRIVTGANGFLLTLTNRHGLLTVEANSIVLATGCTECTAKQISMHGTRPAGVMTAGNAQYYMNILGQLPGRRCIIFGSSDIGMAVARQLSLEGAKVLIVFEEKQTPGGSLRNVSHCLSDFDIPLHFGYRIMRVFGVNRVWAVEFCRVDKNLNLIPGTENTVKCDSLILAAGLTPETTLADSLGVPISDNTLGPICDQNNMTLVDGVFCCGNALHINSTVDYISESGDIAGRSAARYMSRERKLIEINTSKDFLCSVPQHLDIDLLHGETVMFFRTKEERKDVTVKVAVNGNEIFVKEFPVLRPSESYRISVNFGSSLTLDSKVDFRMEHNKSPAEHDHAVTEMTPPERTLTTTVRTKFPGVPALSVRTDGEISKYKFTEVMHELSKVIVAEELKCGDTLLEDVAKTGVHVIVTSTALMQLGAELENKNVELQRLGDLKAGTAMTGSAGPGIGMVRNPGVLDDLGAEAAGGFVGAAGEAVGVEDGKDDDSNENTENENDDDGYIRPKKRPHIKR